MASRLPTIPALQTFEAVSRHGTFVSAAEERCVSPSAVSHQIGDLESLLEVQLFVREHQGVKLTREGRYYLEHVQAFLSGLSTATSAIRGHGRHEVIVHTYASISRRLLVPNLNRFMRAHPDIGVQCQHAPSDHMFLNESHAVSIMSGHPQTTDAECHELAQASLIPICSRRYADDAATLAEPEDIARHQLIRSSGWKDDWECWLAISGQANVPLSSGVTFPNRDTAVFAAENHLGLALAPRFITRMLGAESEVLLPFDFELPSPNLFLVVPKSIRDLDPVRIFCDWILEASKHLRG